MSNMFYIFRTDKIRGDKPMKTGFIGKFDLSLLVRAKSANLVQLILRHDYKDNHDVAKSN